MSDSGKTRREINYWLNRLEQSVAHAEVKPFRSDNEIVTKLYESVEGLVTREVIDNLCERDLSGDKSPDVVGIALLANTYAMKDYHLAVKEGFSQRRKAINEAKARMDRQEAGCQGNESEKQSLLKAFRDATAQSENRWLAGKAAKLSEDPRMLDARSVWLKRQSRQSIIDGVRFLLTVSLEPDEPGNRNPDNDSWVLITNVDHFIRSGSSVSRYVNNENRPEIRRLSGTKRGKYEVRRSKLREYIKWKYLEEYGVHQK